MYVVIPEAATQADRGEGGAVTNITLLCPNPACKRVGGRHNGKYWWTPKDYEQCPDVLTCAACGTNYRKPASPFGKAT